MISTKRLLVPVLAWAAVALSPACSDDDSSLPKFDGWFKKDRGPDRTTPREGGTDGPAADLSLVEAGADLAKPDLAKPDGTVTATPEKVIFSANGSSGKYTLYEMMTDGSGYKALPGFLSNFKLTSLNVANHGQLNYYPTDLDRKRTSRFYRSGIYWLELPNKMGRLARWDSGSSTQGYSLVSPAGKVTALDYGAGSSNGYSSSIAISSDGKLAAAVKEEKKLVLIKLDGSSWPGGLSPVKDVTPAGFKDDVIYDESLTMTKSNLYFVTNNSASSIRSLYMVPQDANKAAAKVALPKVGKAVAATVGTRSYITPDRMHSAWLVGSSTTEEDVVVIKDGAAAVNVSKLGDNLYAVNNGLFDGLYPLLALSPGGKQVAYGSISGSNAGRKFWVTKADGSGLAARIDSSSNFSSSVDNYGGFFFATDDDLLFWAGPSSTEVDLFHYKVSTKALSNLTKSGAATKAPWSGGKLECDGGWISPNGKYLYLLAGDPSASSKWMDIMVLDLGAFTLKSITNKLYIDSESNAHLELETVPGSKYVWFAAYKTGGSVNIEDVYVFDQESGDPKTLTNLTKHGGGSSVAIQGLGASPDSKYASYITGGSGKERLYIVPTAGGTAKALTAGSGYVEDLYQWTSQSNGIVYAKGNSTSKMDLYFDDLSGTPKIIKAAGQYLRVLSVGK